MGIEGEYDFVPGQGKFKVTENMKSDFNKLGYIIVRDLLSTEEIHHIEPCLHQGDFIKNIMQISDGEGRVNKMCLWNHPGDDITGMVGRCEKVVHTMEELLGGEVYHYHTKLIMKEPKTGGQFVWHQDYGYWYKNGILYPDMATLFIALDKTDEENGCLRIIPGSHKCGRLDHIFVDGQSRAHPDHVEVLKEQNKVLPVNMNPGDGLFFHCNLLHTSSSNRSDRRRWGFLCAYNKATNDATIEHHHPKYTPLKKVPDSAILECTNMDTTGKAFMAPETDVPGGGSVESRKAAEKLK